MKIVDAFDHFVVPVDDLVIAEKFYEAVFDGRIIKRNGLNVSQRKRGAVPHTFIVIGDKRIGVYLQSDDRPKPRGVRGTPTYSFTTSLKGIEETMAELRRCDVEYAGPLKSAHPFAFQSLFFHDPAVQPFVKSETVVAKSNRLDW